MALKIRKTASLSALALASLIALTGCSAAEEPKAPVAKEAPAEETPAQEEVSTGDTPVWFKGSLDAGELIGEGSTDSWNVKVFQVGTGATDKDSMFVDPETNTNILPAGSEVVYLNFVYTNTSSEAIPLGSITDPRVTSSTWKFATGQPGAVGASLYEAFGLSSDGYDAGKREQYDAPFVVEPGQSIAIATSIKYEPGVAATAKPGFIPKDAAGDLVHDKKEEAEITFTVK